LPYFFRSITSFSSVQVNVKWHLVGVVFDDRRAGLLADVEGLVRRETTRGRPLDLGLPMGV
jgi:hypothetical protein